jgi:hypothetical protein
MNAKVLTPNVTESVDKYDSEWKELCAAVVFRRNLELLDGNGRMTTVRTGAVIFVLRPPELNDEDAQALEDAIAAECNWAIRMARRVRALTRLESIERIDQQLKDSVSSTQKALEALKSGAETAKSSAELIELAGNVLPKILTAWVWLRALHG